MSGANDLRFIGSEFHKWGDELQNEPSANFSLMETGGTERHRWSEERLLPGGLIFIKGGTLVRLCGGCVQWRWSSVTDVLGVRLSTAIPEHKLDYVIDRNWSLWIKILYKL